MFRKVAIIDPLGAHGSSHHFYIFGQSYGLKYNNVNVSIYTNSETHNPNIDGVRFYQTFGNLFSNKLAIVIAIRYILGTIKSVFHARFRGVSVFHFHIFYNNFLVLFSCLIVKLLFGKLVLTVHDVESFAMGNRFMLKSSLLYKFSDLILTHNQFSKDEIIKLAPNLKYKVHIIPHGNYIPFIKVSEDKKKSREYLALPSDKTVLLFFGMIKKVKGLDVLLESFKKVVAENSDVVLLIAGRPWQHDFDFYKKIIDKYHLADNIILHTKFIEENDVSHYYCASDLVVLPYKRIYQSGVLIMTLSYIRPVLVSNLLPLKEIIVDNENGFLFKSEDVNDLAEKLKLILADKNNLENVRKNGYNFIKDKYSWEKIGSLTKTAYQSL